MRYLLFPLLVSICLISNGCSHDPVYPSTGSLYVSSSPPVVEILIDGKMTNRFTPAKIDGIEVGVHQVSLRYYNRKNWNGQVEIKPGQTTRLAVIMEEIEPAIIQKYNFGPINLGDMAYVPEARKIAVCFTSENYMTVLSLGDSTILASTNIDLGSGQKAVMAANFYADRIYVCLDNYSITSVGLTSGQVGRTMVFGYPLTINDMIFSHDGLWAYVANASDSSIFIVNAVRDSVVRTIKLNGAPTELIEDEAGNYLYVLFKDNGLLSKIDVNSGAVVSSLVTGNEPMGLFWKNDYQTIGLCNSTDRTILLAEANNFVVATSPVFVYGEIVNAACYSVNGYHLWALEATVTSIGDELPASGRLGLLYQPTGQFVGHFNLGSVPFKIAQSPDGKYLYIIEAGSRDILVFRTDIYN